MRPKNKLVKKTDEGGEGEWIMSYADTVTLLLCFFVIFFSQSKMAGKEDQETKKKIRVIAEIVEEKQTNTRKVLEELQKLLIAEFKKQSLNGIEVKQDTNEVIVRLNEKEFFGVGSYKLIKNGKTSLSKIASSLKKIATKFDIYVEGHTDSMPVKGSVYYKSNLGLSSLRASTAAEVLIAYGIDKSKVRAIGYGDSQPLAEDRILASETKEVQYLEAQSKLNRRVEIRLVYQEKDL